MESFLQLSATRMAQAIRSREISSSTLVAMHLAQIERVNPSLNAVVTLAGDQALEAAHEADRLAITGTNLGPLHGVPMTIKDSFDTVGVRTTGGTVGRKDHIPTKDATAVARLKAAGAILLGKTNTSEITYSFEVDNHVFGRTNNPYNLGRSSGGSSGGEAAIIAACGAPFGLGTDTGGSIRLPAHYCGIAGLKPTSARVPRTGHIIDFGFTVDSLTVVGPMARRVEDLAMLLAIIAGPDGLDPSIPPVPLHDPSEVSVPDLRVAYFTDDGYATPTQETQDAVRAAAEALQRSGTSVTEIVPPGVGEVFDLFVNVFEGDGGVAARRVLRAAGTADEDVHPFTRWVLEKSIEDTMTAGEYNLIVEKWDHFRKDMLRFMQHFDIIVCPANGKPALAHGFRFRPEDMRNFSYTLAHNLTGYPVAVVRAGTSPEGLPIGVQIVAGPWREHVALAAASVVEAASGGWQPSPLFV